MILCCGEALIDMLPRQTPAGEAAFAPFVGGAVYNTARAIGRLGAPAGFFCGISTDFFGDMLRDGLVESKVDISPVVESDRPTTLAFVKLVDGQASYIFYDENSASRMVTVDDLPALPSSVKALFFGGISLIPEPCGTAYETLMAREAGKRLTMIDPNIRPTLVSDEAAYRGRVTRMIGHADIVKLSDEDLAWVEKESDIDVAVNGILERGPEIVIITRGGEGATAYRKSGAITVAARSVKVVDTVGAGDTFNAGFMTCLSEAGITDRAGLAGLADDTIEAALTLGGAAASVTISRAGANPPWREELPV
ncbi:carbohydrate kinase family protein [Rhodobium gokarnense]|uniref:Fructokinase n=1 Tax=Rhodobium gokarnense TaxID=364296 RepID=A0ABT3H9Y1_9HYPH|nr:carbohydrate kinase [Rhodobium gokarnense]MCW2307194.1 fructokinase [Rhodobium gokarnense]